MGKHKSSDDKDTKKKHSKERASKKEKRKSDEPSGVADFLRKQSQLEEVHFLHYLQAEVNPDLLSIFDSGPSKIVKPTWNPKDFSGFKASAEPTTYSGVKEDGKEKFEKYSGVQNQVRTSD